MNKADTQCRRLLPEHSPLFPGLMLADQRVAYGLTCIKSVIKIRLCCRFKQPELRFFEMLSIMSALKVGRADKVLIHTDEQLSGEYWDLVRQDNR